MKLDVVIENCGKISKANVSIAPFTVIGGANSSGKSFITRSLYSIFKSISDNSLQGIGENLLLRLLHMTSVSEYELIAPSKQVQINHDALLKSVHSIEKNLAVLQSEKSLSSSLRDKVVNEKISLAVRNCNVALLEVEKIKKYEDYKNSLIAIRDAIAKFSKYINSPETLFSDILCDELKDVFQDNFQIVDLLELKNHKSNINEPIKFKFKNIGKIEIEKDKVSAEFDINKTTNLEELNNVVFLESPVYWKLRKILVSSERGYQNRFFRNIYRKNYLTGVPRYFLDLVKLVETKYKSNDNSSENHELYNDIFNLIGGELDLLDSDVICFRDKETNRNININLTASGITNLGLIGLLLKQNVIAKGSFIFVDEPEVNLHPAWQKVLVDVLYRLSQSGVNIVMASHSVDMMKYIENIMEELSEVEINQHFAVTQMSKDGVSINEDLGPLEKLYAIKSDLSSSYIDMFMEGSW
ncbi:TPA: ATP-binding protein [Vibrio vulnificus]|uniref:ATP-binding protein n=1 Tax=Vibrio vulnificus TaxID=672 RepID=UPI0021DA4160|nr:ATP-binding protein [Vibrio vulnificus]MCU8402130.1 ATP-binding protein [Vibrio vulnificus]